MSDLISRQEAIDAMESINDSICEQQAIDALCELPSAQPAIIRCKDCKHKEHCFSMVHMCEKNQRNYVNRDIDYCSYGERSEK